MKKLFLIGSVIALSGCAHAPLTAPCKPAQVAAANGGDCVPKPINYAVAELTTTKLN